MWSVNCEHIEMPTKKKKIIKNDKRKVFKIMRNVRAACVRTMWTAQKWTKFGAMGRTEKKNGADTSPE